MSSPDRLSLNQRTQVINALLSRQSLLKGLIDPKRDIDAECGYPDSLDKELYRQMWEREGIAARVVGVMPDESWALDPELIEGEQSADTAFEKEWKQLVKRHNLLSHLQRADTLSGVGAYGILLLGIDDGKELHLPVEGVDDTTDFEPKKTGKKHQLLYVRAFDETVLEVDTYEMNVNSPRFGLPVSYSVKFQDIKPGNISATQLTKKVHWTRIIHIADNRRNSEIFGTPRMQLVFNRLYDLKKLLGGAPEMFWKGAFPGLSLEVNPDLVDVEIDSKATREEMENYMNGLQRYLALVGVSAKSLAPQVADPSMHFEMIIKAICISLKCPYRIFMGTEEAQLAGSQDIRAWNTRLKYRQEKYITPWLFRPLVYRLMAYGVLSFVPDPSINWKDLNTLTDTEKAEIASKRTEALSKYVAGGVDSLVPPREYFIHFLDLPGEQADAILDAADSWIEENAPEKDAEIQAARGSAFKPPELKPEPKLVPGAPNGRKPASASAARR